MKFKVKAEKPPLSKTDSPVPGEVARSARRGAGGRRRRPEGFRRAMPCTLSHPQTGRNPSASQARHLPLTREAFVCGVRVGDCTEGLLWPQAGTAARGLASLRSPFSVGCRAGCPHPAEVGGRQNATGLADRRGGFHIRPWESVLEMELSETTTNAQKIPPPDGGGILQLI